MAPTAYLPTSRPALHEAGSGIEITVLPEHGQGCPPCGECPETGPIELADAVIRYRSPVMRIVIADAVCLACLPVRVAGLRAARIEILDLALYSPVAGSTPRIARLNYERSLLVEHLFTANDPRAVDLIVERYAHVTETLRLIAAGGVR